MKNRIALCIGNSRYSAEDLDDLPNAGNDAELINSTLLGRGFDSELLKDATGYDIQDAIGRLKNKAAAAGNAFAVIYFAGHGFETGGLGFLMPADLPDHISLSAIVNMGVPTLSLVDALAGCTGPKIIILDACRSDAAEMAGSEEISLFNEKAKGLKKVFREVLDTKDLVFAFATGAGKPAGDGVSGHSRYCEALAAEMLSHNCTLDELFASVTQKVIRSTKIKQQPWYLSSLTFPVSLSDLPTFQAVPYEIYRRRDDNFVCRVCAIGEGRFVYAVDRAVIFANGRVRYELESCNEDIATLATSGENVYALLTSGDVLYKKISNHPAEKFKKIYKAVGVDFNAMAVSPDGMALIIGGMWGYEVVCCVSGEWTCRAKNNTVGHSIHNVKFFDDNRAFLCGSNGLVRDLKGIKSSIGELEIFDFPAGGIDNVNDIEFLKDRQEIVVVCSSGLVAFVSLETNKILKELTVNNAELSLVYDYGILRNNLPRDFIDLYDGDLEKLEGNFADDPSLFEIINSIFGKQSLLCCTRLKDDRILAIGSDEGFVFLFDARERALFRTIDVGGGLGINLRWLCADTHSDSFTTMASDGMMTRYVAIPPRF